VFSEQPTQNYHKYLTSITQQNAVIKTQQAQQMLRWHDMQTVGCCQSAKLTSFYAPLVQGLSRYNLKSQDIMISANFSTQVDKIPNYPAMCQFQLFVTLCDHNPRTIETDGRNRCYAHSISVTCEYQIKYQFFSHACYLCSDNYRKTLNKGARWHFLQH